MSSSLQGGRWLSLYPIWEGKGAPLLKSPAITVCWNPCGLWQWCVCDLTDEHTVHHSCQWPAHTCPLSDMYRFRASLSSYHWVVPGIEMYSRGKNTPAAPLPFWYMPNPYIVGKGQGGDRNCSKINHFLVVTLPLGVRLKRIVLSLYLLQQGRPSMVTV